MSLDRESSVPPWDAVSHLLRCRLAYIRSLRFFTSDHRPTDTFQFELNTNTGDAWTVLSGNDGESTSIRSGVISESDAADISDLGYLKIVDEISHPVEVLHKEIKSIRLFHLNDNLLIGFRFTLKDGGWLEIVNAGDKLVLLVNEEHPLVRCVRQTELGD
jgi:hypothetical protein